MFVAGCWDVFTRSVGILLNSRHGDRVVTSMSWCLACAGSSLGGELQCNG